MSRITRTAAAQKIHSCCGNLQEEIAVLRNVADRLERELRTQRRSCLHENVTEHFDGTESFDECLDCGMKGKHLLQPGQTPIS